MWHYTRMVTQKGQQQRVINVSMKVPGCIRDIVISL